MKQIFYLLVMNLSHVISEFSFGQFFPNIVQPLDNSVEVTDKRELSFIFTCPRDWVFPIIPAD